MAGSAHEDDESVLSMSEQKNRPLDVAILQQRIPAWHPVLDPVWVVIALFYLGVILVPTGLKMDSLQGDVVELKSTYDDYAVYQNGTLDLNRASETIQACAIGEKYNANYPYNGNGNTTCILNFTVPKDMQPPILIHYELTNFHQNHRDYFEAHDAHQLNGRVGSQDDISRDRCEPLNKLGGITINPCGLTANTFFNDKFTLLPGSRDALGNNLTMMEEGIAWQSDLKWKFKQPEGFDYEECPGACDASCCEGDEWSCNVPYENEDGCFRYYYPNDNTTQYLYETYPNLISPLDGVTNEHFIVWMRIAAQPKFRKLYGWIDQPVAAGQVLSFLVELNYVVTRFRGSKSLIVGTTSIFGGRNPYMAPVFTYVGVFCLSVGFIFSLKQAFFRRKMGSDKYLSYKKDE